MDVSAAVMTAKETAAISTILLHGPDAAKLLAEVFESSSASSKLEPGQVAVGRIIDEYHTIDHVAVACEDVDCIAIHCHGNPLIVEMTMKLLRNRGAGLVEAEQMLARTTPRPANTIAAEVRIALSKAPTITAARIIAAQKAEGLTAVAAQLLDSAPAEIAEQASQILSRTARIRPVLEGCTAVLIGPPNSGKSTLLNSLAGRNRAIVTDIPGTTRDWVTATCLIEPLRLELVDTAGLDAALSGADRLEQTAQNASACQLSRADIALLILDAGRSAEQLNSRTVELLRDIPTITVANKSDLPKQLDVAELPSHLRPNVQISAAKGTGIDELLAQIVRTLGLHDVDPQSPVCFTQRQQQLLQQLTTIDNHRRAVEIITELLEGPLCV